MHQGRKYQKELQERLKALENEVKILKQKVIYHNVRWVQQTTDFVLLSRRVEKLEKPK
jgi:hypothetical protein